MDNPWLVRNRLGGLGSIRRRSPHECQNDDADRRQHYHAKDRHAEQFSGSNSKGSKHGNLKGTEVPGNGTSMLVDYG